MIVHFPELYDDETFYSGCARYGERTPWQTNRGIQTDLFGTPTMCNREAFPTRLGQFVRNLPDNMKLGVKEIIDKHTVVPVFTFFSDSEAVKRLYSDMESNPKQLYPLHLHGAASLSTFLRYCPECVKDDRQKVGEAYWHRIHQIAAVRICPNHRAFLIESSIVRGVHTYHSIFSLESSLPKSSKVEILTAGNPWHDLQAWIAEQCFWVLTHPTIKLNRRDLIGSYRRELLKAGFIHPYGPVKASEFARALDAKYRRKWLISLRCQSHSETRGTHWIYDALNHGAGNTVQHLLLISVFGIDLLEFVRRTSESSDEQGSETEASRRLPSRRPAKNPSQPRRDLYRQRIANCIRDNPNATRTQLVRSLAKKEAHWLWRNDHEWFETVLPPKRRAALTPPKHRFDWNTRDTHLSQQVDQVRTNILNYQGRPIRVTRMQILTRLGFRPGHSLEKLVLTSRAIDSAVESDQEIALRRLLWLASNSTWTSRPRSLSRIIEHARVREEWKSLPRFNKVIQRAQVLLRHQPAES